MGRGRLEVLVDNAWRTHVGRRGGEGCYDTYRSVLYREPRASPWPFRVTGVSYARARQRPGGLTVSPHARFGTASGGGRKCGEKRRGVGRRAAPRTAGHPSRGRDTCGSEGRSPPRRAMLLALCTLKEQHCSRNAPPQVPLVAHTRKPSRRYTRPLHAAVTRGRYTRTLHAAVTHGRYTRPLHATVTHSRYTRSSYAGVTRDVTRGRYTRASHAGVTRGRYMRRYTQSLHTVVTHGEVIESIISV